MTGLAKLENRLPAPLKKRGTAILVAILLAVGSVLGLGGWKLRGQVQAVEKIFYEKGGISDNIDARAQISANILSLADRLPDAKADSEVKALNKALEKLEKAKGPEEESLADRKIEDAKIALVDALQEPAKADNKINDLLAGQAAEFEAAGSRISYAAKDYNKKADEMNAVLHRFPANIIRLLSGAGEVEYCK